MAAYEFAHFVEILPINEHFCKLGFNVHQQFTVFRKVLYPAPRKFIILLIVDCVKQALYPPPGK